jgi:hypothetical protein
MRRFTIGVIWMVAASLGGAAPVLARSTVKPERALPGDALLVTMDKVRAGTDAQTTPRVTVGTSKRPAVFWPVKGGWQGVVAIPEDTPAGAIAVTAESPWDLDTSVVVREREVREVEVVVDDRFVNPTPEDKRWNEEDHKLVGRAFANPVEHPLFTRAFVWPRTGKVTSGFGEQRRFNGVLDSVHEGVDLLAPTGAPVRAANDGVVVLRRDCFNSGQTIFIDHGGGIFTGYFHLSEMQVEDGARVRRGQRIGLVGNTGRSSGPHLHFAVRADGRYVDPQTFMKIRLQRPLSPARPTQAAAR